MGAPQSITTRIQPKRRLWLKASFFVILLFPVGAYIAVREWDSYSAYSGVVIEKGMDCNLCFLGRSRSLALYLILRDDLGRRSKRYVGSSFSYADTKRWNETSVGSFIVKDRGYGEHPYEPGKKPVSPPHTKGDGWLLLAIILICGTVLAVKVRQFWDALSVANS